jgi:hypothetical protein
MINYKHSANNDACRLAKKTSNIDASGSIQYNSQQARLNVIKMGKTIDKNGSLLRGFTQHPNLDCKANAINHGKLGFMFLGALSTGMM